MPGKQLWEVPANLSSDSAGAARAIAGHRFQACSEDITLHMPRISQICHTVMWWSFLGNPSSGLEKPSLTASPLFIPPSFPDRSASLWQSTSSFTEQLAEPVNGAGPSTRDLRPVLQQPAGKRVQPHLQAKASSPSEPSCNSLCKLQSEGFFPGELCCCFMPPCVLTELNNISRHLPDDVASRY